MKKILAGNVKSFIEHYIIEHIDEPFDARDIIVCTDEIEICTLCELLNANQGFKNMMFWQPLYWNRRVIEYNKEISFRTICRKNEQ